AFPSRITPCLHLTVFSESAKYLRRSASVSSENDSETCDIAFASVTHQALATLPFPTVATRRRPSGFHSRFCAQDRQRFHPMLLSVNIDKVDDSYRLNARAINENGNKI
ncbi:hypothetical protein, partial [Escherichia coli]|uniref:hypothetical protein n=1 Tax=Escherichia coli TaxID=562 RepID=UPI002280151A